jgi:hypothetical protein
LQDINEWRNNGGRYNNKSLTRPNSESILQASEMKIEPSK